LQADHTARDNQSTRCSDHVKVQQFVPGWFARYPFQMPSGLAVRFAWVRCYMQVDPEPGYSSVKCRLYSDEGVSNRGVEGELDRWEQWPAKSKNEKLELRITASYEKINTKPVICWSTE